MNKTNWDDIRFVLAVRRYGSLNAAARALGVAHATVLRRVALFEQRHARPVFHKAPSGYTPRPDALPVFNAMENVEDSVMALGRTIAGADQSPTGTVRIASTDSLCLAVLPTVLQRIADKYPGIEVTLLSNNTHHDLTRLTADIVVRPSTSLDDNLSGQRAGDLAFAVYDDGVDGRKWLALHGPLSRSLPGKWMADTLSPTEVVSGADSFLVLRQLAASGVGKVFLPTFLGDAELGLRRIPDAAPRMTVPVWVATLEEISNTPRFALVRDLLVRQLQQTFPADLA